MAESPSPRQFRKRDQSEAQSFNFGTEVRHLVRSLAEELGISQVAVLELAIRRLARRATRGDDTGPAESRNTAPAGAPQSFRLSVTGRQLLREVAGYDPPRFGDSQVAVMELAIRRFAQFAAREGLVDTMPRSPRR